MTDTNGNDSLVRITYYQGKYNVSDDSIKAILPKYFHNYMEMFCHCWRNPYAKSKVEIEGVNPQSIVEEVGKKSIKWFIPKSMIHQIISTMELLRKVDDRIRKQNGETENWFTLKKNVQCFKEKSSVVMGVEVEGKFEQSLTNTPF